MPGVVATLNAKRGRNGSPPSRPLPSSKTREAGVNSIEQDGGANAEETFVNCAEVKVGGEHVVVPSPKQGLTPGR